MIQGITISKGDTFYDSEEDVTYKVVLVDGGEATILNSTTNTFMDFRVDVLLESSHGEKAFLRHTQVNYPLGKE